MNSGTDGGNVMRAISYQDSIGGWSVLERGDAQESRASEAAWLSVTWCSLASWSVPIQRRSRTDTSRQLTEREPAPQPKEAEPDLLTLARQYVEEHSAETLSLEAVTNALRIEASQLGELVRQATEMDFPDFVTAVRIQKAKRLLLNPHSDFTEIASEVGFPSLTQLIETFEKIAGQSPHAWRARLPGSFCCTARGS